LQLTPAPLSPTSRARGGSSTRLATCDTNVSALVYCLHHQIRAVLASSSGTS
jgi:hypothetical protein